MQYGQTNRAANAGVSLRAELETIGFHEDAIKGFVSQYATLSVRCTNNNRILRPSIGAFVNHLKANNAG